MAELKTGDICPCCGKPIETDDPFKLVALAAIEVDKGVIPLRDLFDTLHAAQRRLYWAGDHHA